MKTKKLLAILLALVMVLTVLAACNNPDNPNPDNPNPDNPDNPGPSTGEYTGAMVENGNTYADPNWLPVVKNPITITAMVRDPLISGNDYTQRTIWKEFADTTGITIDLQVTTATEPEALMFASRNYPDVAFRIYVDSAQLEACYNGDIIELEDEMLATYAPNWYKLFEDYPDVYKMTLQPNGKLYSLPQFVMEESAYELRDIHFINNTWLDEVGMDAPTTIDEYTEYLRAVKNARGTGSIPEHAEPLYMRLNTANIGGYFGILDMFGVYQGFNYEIVDNGKVENNAQNIGLREAVKWMAQLWSEDLIAEEGLAGDWNKYQTAIGNDFDGADSIWVGSFFGYSLNAAYQEDFMAIAPLEAGTEEGPYTREFGMENRIIPKALSIFATSKYPIAILRAFDHYATGEGAMRAVIGEEGEDLQWYKDADGKYIYGDKAWVNTTNTNSYGWNDTAPGVVTPDIVEQLIRNSLENEDDRIYIYHNMYKQYLPEDKCIYPKAALNFLSTDEYSEAETLRTQINSVVNLYFKKWVQNKTDVYDEWDDFQDKLINVGIERRLELLQKGYDAYLEATE